MRGVLARTSERGCSVPCRICDRLASDGYVALAPDLYDGKTASTIGEAKALRARVGASRKKSACRYLIRMIGELESQAAGDLALLGFSMGGHWAYWLSRRPELPISKTVTFYAARRIPSPSRVKGA